MRETYIEPDQYAAMVAALTAMKPANPFGGTIEAADIMVALGERANIWPASVLDDPDRGMQLQRANRHVPGEDRTSAALDVLILNPDDDDL